MTNFEKSLTFVFGSEGGYSDHPNDRGGKTNMGITESTLIRAYQAGIVGHKDIGQLTRKEAADIYEQFYWLPSCCHKMQSPLCTIHFDAAVNHGIGGAAKLLQQALNAHLNAGLKVDGGIGGQTMAALGRVADIKAFCRCYLDQREAYFKRIIANNPSQIVFQRGWFNRLNKNRKYIEGA